jgi:alanine-glyoxylate transaminase/serine-glyoxylate transaminase/serine-pyruvate transaminase
MPRPNTINPSRSFSNVGNCNPSSRLSLISRHLVDQQPLNTPYTTERLPNTIDTSLLPKTPNRTMSSQPEHPTLLIPGPIEFDDAVLHSMSHYRFVS